MRSQLDVIPVLGSQRVDRHTFPLRRRSAAFMLAVASIVSACTSPEVTANSVPKPAQTEQAEDEAETTPTATSDTDISVTTTTIPDAQSPDELVFGYIPGDEPYGDLCSVDFPEAAPANFDHVAELDAISQELFVLPIPESVVDAIDSVRPILDKLEGMYGVEIHYQTTDNVDNAPGMSEFDISDVDTDYDSSEVWRSTDTLVKALKRLPPEVFKYANVEEIWLTGGITTLGEPDDNWGGFYNFVMLFEDNDGDGWYETNESTHPTIVVDALFSEETFIHEWAHAFDDAICGYEDFSYDYDFFKYNTMDGYNYDYRQSVLKGGEETFGEEFERQFPYESYTLTGERVFANAYATTNVREDRSTTLADLFVARGIIQKGDPDYGTPYYYKQLEMLRRAEIAFPGITAWLEQATPSMRATNPELAELRNAEALEEYNAVLDSMLPSMSELEQISEQLLNQIINPEQYGEPTYLSQVFLIVSDGDKFDEGVIVLNPIVSPVEFETSGKGGDPFSGIDSKTISWFEKDVDGGFRLITIPNDPRRVQVMTFIEDDTATTSRFQLGPLEGKGGVFQYDAFGDVSQHYHAQSNPIGLAYYSSNVYEDFYALFNDAEHNK